MKARPTFEGSKACLWYLSALALNHTIKKNWELHSLDCGKPKKFPYSCPKLDCLTRKTNPTQVEINITITAWSKVELFMIALVGPLQLHCRRANNCGHMYISLSCLKYVRLSNGLNLPVPWTSTCLSVRVVLKLLMLICPSNVPIFCLFYSVLYLSEIRF